MSGSQAAGNVLENPNPMLYESKKPGVPGEPLTMHYATTKNDRAQRKHDQAYVITPADTESHT